MATIIREAAAASALVGSRQEITLITPGWGSSGYYSPEVLEQAAKDRAFPAKTQMHIDHDGEMARYENPAGSLTRFAAALTEDARWEPNWVDPENPGELPGRLVAEAKVMPNWREFLTAAAEYIGTSVASAAKFTKGDAGGRKGTIVEALLPDPLNRVDYVTVAGRGGRISAVRESARRIEETVADDIRQWLRQAVRDTHATGDNWAYLEDHNDDFAYFTTDGATYQQAYTLDGVNVTLDGEPIEVRRRVEYDPVDTPAAEAATSSPPDPAGVTTNQEEANMATIDDKELATLRESASRAVTVEAELTEAKQKLAAAESATTKATAERIIAEAFGDTEAKVTRRALLAEALTADTFDPEALKATAAEAAAEIAVTNGAGTPRFLGESTQVTTTGKTFTSESIVSALHGEVA